MISVSVFIPRSSVIESVTPGYRIFKSANDFLINMGRVPMFDVQYVALSHEVKIGDGEYKVRAGKLLKNVEETDVLILPALYGDLPEALRANEEAIFDILRLHKQGTLIVSLCLGAFLLARTGLLDNRRCSTHWAFYDQFREMYPKVNLVDGSVITDEGNIFSSGGANSIWNLLLYLVEKLANRELAVTLSKYFAIDIDRNSQSTFAIFNGQKNHADTEILHAQEYIEMKIEDRITVSDLAEKLALSRRSFERRFRKATNNSVLEYIQRIKMEAAKRSFERSRKNINEVMFEVGYTDNKAFRSVFKKVTGLTPIEYRAKYNKAG